MNREEMLNRVTHHPEPWSIIIIGGGATGMGVAWMRPPVDTGRCCWSSTTSAGNLEPQHPLVHGGVRYLEQATSPS